MNRKSPASIRLILALLALSAAPTQAQALDPAYSRFGFELRTRWGHVVEGNFPRFEGEVVELPDGRHQVRIRLATDAVEVPESTRYTHFARSEGFLDASRHPWLEFQSEPYSSEVVRDGGPLRGTLTLRGVSRPESFQLEPSTCDRPARDCDTVAQGRVSCSDYGMSRWRWALLDEVRFKLRVRLQDTP